MAFYCGFHIHIMQYDELLKLYALSEFSCQRDPDYNESCSFTPGNYFRCHDGMCVCNGREDCRDGSDEGLLECGNLKKWQLM